LYTDQTGSSKNVEHEGKFFTLSNRLIKKKVGLGTDIDLEVGSLEANDKEIEWQTEARMSPIPTKQEQPEGSS